MKVRFYRDSGVNRKSVTKWLSPTEDFQLEEGEWERLDDDEKWEYANKWAQSQLEIGCEEKE